MADKPKKTENGIEFPAEAYAYVPDPEKPSTWKLRLWEDLDQKETPRQVGMAVAALSPGGFRGNRVEIPREDLPAVKRRVLAAWRKVHPDAKPEDIPPVLRESADAGLGQDASTDASGQRLLEYSSSRGLPLRVDRDRAVIYGVKILGLESQNGRVYTPQALAEARQLYEGKPVNVDHADGSRRSYRDRIGRLVSVELRADGLYGDLLVNPKHPLAEQLFWDAEHCPENVGLSHDAQGRTRAVGGRVIVEQIQQVRSVDLVAEPATTRSLYEDQQAEPAGGPSPTVLDEPQADEIEDVDKLPDEAFALILPGGVKIGQRTWPLHKRYFPIHTPSAVRRSLERIAANRKLAPEHLAIARQRAMDAARRFGIVVTQLTKESIMELEKLTLEELKEARPDLVAQIQAAGEAQAELVKLKEDRDKLAAELAAIKRQEELITELTAAKISYDQVPQSLLESLKSATTEKRKAMIEDLKSLLTQRPPVTSARSMGGLPQQFEDRVKQWA